MNYLNISKNDINNGEGIRVVLWVAGCSHHCKGCQNSFSWEPNIGIPAGNDMINEIVSQLLEQHVSGITYSGGDPLHENNREVISNIVDFVNMNFPNKTQWLYTGYTKKELDEMNDPYINNILSKIDVLLDGRFVEELKSDSLKWVGSSNQNIIYLKK